MQFTIWHNVKNLNRWMNLPELIPYRVGPNHVVWHLQDFAESMEPFSYDTESWPPTHLWTWWNSQHHGVQHIVYFHILYVIDKLIIRQRKWMLRWFCLTSLFVLLLDNCLDFGILDLRLLHLTYMIGGLMHNHGLL